MIRGIGGFFEFLDFGLEVFEVLLLAFPECTLSRSILCFAFLGLGQSIAYRNATMHSR